MNLLKYWPTEKDCLECIKPQAENPSDAVFLAIHQEMPLLRRGFDDKPNASDERTQKQLLEEFLSDSGTGCVIIPILGESGIGKSHLVRWLDVQLRLREDNARRHVIRIPKGCSLKSVLGLILEGLEGTAYQKIKERLTSAREQMDPVTAKQRIRAELLSAIEHRYQTASRKKQESQISGAKLNEIDRKWYGHGDPRALPALLGDPETQRLFMDGTASRPGIISELARGITEDTEGDDQPRSQFELEDFNIPDELASDINKASDAAKKYLGKLSRTTNAKLVIEVVDLLNGIVDEAKAELVMTPDTSLSELFYDVRRKLLQDDRELVLLVEDFAVLAGVQKALLDAIIREGETGGKTEACMIRTALAVTDGYFGNLDTVKTRAVNGWWIRNGEDDDDETVLNRIGNLVAAYVNAARIGSSRLAEHYNDAAMVGTIAPDGLTMLGIEEEDESVLADFGRSADGYSMFPFNQLAIQTLAEWLMTDNQGRLRFNPRRIISKIVLPVTWKYREEFRNQTFPPQSFLGYPETRPSPDLKSELSVKENNRERFFQYLNLLEIWGNRPDRIATAEVPEGVFQAFGLKPLDEHSTTVKPRSLRPNFTPKGVQTQSETGSTSNSKDKPTTEQEPEAISKFLDKINDWRGGGILGQAEANKIRDCINTHVLNSINWEAELLRPVNPAAKHFRNKIYLPRARGNPPLDVEKAFVVVASEDEFASSTIADNIFFLFRALIRYDYHDGWHYKESEKDYTALSNFIEGQLTRASSWVRSNYKNLDCSPVSSLTQSLLWQARQLNVGTAHRIDDASQIDAVFAQALTVGEQDNHQEWNEFLQEMASKRHLLKDELMERVGAFQGIGKTPHAVDASQILSTIQEFRKTWQISEKFPRMPNSPMDDLKTVDRHISALIRFGTVRIEERRKRIADQSKLIVAELGKNYDKNELLKDLEEVCSLAEQHGLKGDVSVGQVRNLAERFKDARAKEAGEQVEAIVTGDDLGARMSAIAKLDIQTYALLVEFAETCSKFLKERAGKAENKILQWTQEVVEIKKDNVDAILEELEEAVKPYRKSDT